MKKIELLAIDCQYDFCDPSGALFVTGANDDMKRLAHFIGRMKDKLSDIHLTLDSHHLVSIFHPIFWRNSNGDSPNPFTMISVDDVDTGKWTTRNPSHYRRALEYVKSLAKSGRYALVIWPPHCLIGSAGYQVVPEVFEAVKSWEQNFAVADYVTKGSNLFTENYSVFKAEVEDPQDLTTQLNVRLIQTLQEADEVVVAGEALSHCLANSLYDLVANFPNESYVKKIVLLTDCTSSVTGFEPLGDKFIKDMTAKGMRTTTSDKYLV